MQILAVEEDALAYLRDTVAQFHPEKYEAPWLDGRRLLENFAAIARRFWADRDSAVAAPPV